MSKNNDFENDLIAQLRASQYYASNQDEVCDDIVGVSRQLKKLSAHANLDHASPKSINTRSSSLMLKAVIQVALNLLDDVDTETINQNL